MLSLPQAENFVLSYPKTGRTWLRALIGAYLHVGRGLPETELIGYRAWEACGFPSTYFTHGQAGFADLIPWQALRPEGRIFAGRRVLLLVRDLRDTMVSAYFWANRRLGIFDGTMSAFLRDGSLGAEKFLAYYRGWYETRQAPRELLVVRYERLHRDAAGTLAAVLRFLGEAQPDPAAIEAAVQYATFSNLRRIEQEGTISLTDHNPGLGEERWRRDDPEATKVRRGVVGGYADYLGKEDLDWLAAQTARLGCPFTVYRPS